MPEKSVKYVARQLLESINHMHKNSFIHRDIKLENILIERFDENGPVIRLIDFGFA